VVLQEPGLLNLDCPNKATSSAYTQVAIVDVSEHEDDEEELEEEL
jgi:hypothetical protein